MNKEQQELLDDAYENYYNYMRDDRQWELDKEEFINKCKTDTDFSETWRLKIKERELSLEERCCLANFAPFDDRSPAGDDFKWDEHTINIAEDWLKQRHPNLPTKLITVTYKNETIESYE